MEPAAAQRDPKTPGGREPELASGGVSTCAGGDLWPGQQEEKQGDRGSSSSSQLQGERLPRAWPEPVLLSAPAGKGGREKRRS
jgi:hypothetical protein